MNDKINKKINIDIDVQNMQSLKDIEKHITKLMSIANDPAFKETRKMLEVELQLIRVQNMEKRNQLQLQNKLNKETKFEYDQLQKSLDALKEKSLLKSKQAGIDRLARAEVQSPVEAVKAGLAESIGQSREKQEIYKSFIKAPILSKEEEAELEKLNKRKRLPKADKLRKAELTTKLEAGTAAKAEAAEQLAGLEKAEVASAAIIGVINGITKVVGAISNTFKTIMGFSLSIKDNFKDIVKNIMENKFDELLEHKTSKYATHKSAKPSLDSLLLKNRSYRGFNGEIKVSAEQLKEIVAVNGRIPSAKNQKSADAKFKPRLTVL